VNKWFFLFLLTFTSFNLFSQVSDTEIEFLEKTSVNLLNRTIYYECQSGSLDNALIKLLSEQNVSISYSYDRVQNYSVKGKVFPSALLSEVLDYLLSKTGLNYVLVGRIIVIVPDERKQPPVEEEKKSDTLTRRSEKVLSHIYKPNQNLEYLPNSERRKIRRLYRAELRWAAEFNQDEFKAIHPDSVDKLKKKPVPRSGKYFSPYYVSIGIGLTEYSPKYKINPKYDILKELKFYRLVKSSPAGSLQLGLHKGHFLFGTGLELRSLRVNGYGGGLALRYKNGRWEYENLTVSYSDSYYLFSIPVNVSGFATWKRVVFTGGITTGFNFIHGQKVNRHKFSSYVEYKYNGESYSEDTRSLTPLSIIHAKLGYWAGKETIVNLGASYSHTFQWYTKSTVYSLFPNNYTFDVSISHFFDKNEFKNLLNFVR